MSSANYCDVTTMVDLSQATPGFVGKSSEGKLLVTPRNIQKHTVLWNCAGLALEIRKCTHYCPVCVSWIDDKEERRM